MTENKDCMIGMKEFPDKYFDLAIVDPPYGKDATKNYKGNFVMTKHSCYNFDNKIPDDEYFSELWRVSKNQIIFGANYFIDHLRATDCMIVWDKVNPLTGKFSDFEIAWTSFHGKSSLIFKQPWIGYGRHFKEKEKSIHPTQKPVDLYRWILLNFSKPGDKILDTHVGSGSSRVACHEMGLQFVGFELDEIHYKNQNTRFENATSQTRLFIPALSIP